MFFQEEKINHSFAKLCNKQRTTHQTFSSFNNITRKSSGGYFIQWNERITAFELAITYQLFASYLCVDHHVIELKIILEIFRF